MPDTAKLERLEGLHALQYRIHHPEARLYRAPTLLDPVTREVGLADGFRYAQENRERLVYTMVIRG